MNSATRDELTSLINELEGDLEVQRLLSPEKRLPAESIKALEDSLTKARGDLSALPTLSPSGTLSPYGYAFFVQETSTQPKETWVRNGMIFATETEARQYGCDLMSRWFGICGGEVREVALHPTYKWVDGRAERLPHLLGTEADVKEVLN